jgi:hypothetical protein
MNLKLLKKLKLKSILKMNDNNEYFLQDELVRILNLVLSPSSNNHSSTTNKINEKLILNKKDNELYTSETIPKVLQFCIGT